MSRGSGEAIESSRLNLHISRDDVRQGGAVLVLAAHALDDSTNKGVKIEKRVLRRAQTKCIVLLFLKIGSRTMHACMRYKGVFGQKTLERKTSVESGPPSASFNRRGSFLDVFADGGSLGAVLVLAALGWTA